jgi:hypothetical protein
VNGAKEQENKDSAFSLCENYPELVLVISYLGVLKVPKLCFGKGLKGVHLPTETMEVVNNLPNKAKES